MLQFLKPSKPLGIILQLIALGFMIAFAAPIFDHKAAEWSYLVVAMLLVTWGGMASRS